MSDLIQLVSVCCTPGLVDETVLRVVNSSVVEHVSLITRGYCTSKCIEIAPILFRISLSRL